MYFIKSKNSLLLGFGLLLIGGNGLILVPTFFKLVLDILLKFSPNSILYGLWKETIPMSFNLYYFNWTNPQELFNSSIKPKFQQIGPYRFKETVDKINITWNDTNNTLSYYMNKNYFYDKENSNGSLSDKVTTVNPTYTFIAYIVRNWNYIMKKGVSIALSKFDPNLFLQRTVKELTFEGFDDKLFSIAQKLSFLVGINLPDLERFAYFAERNSSLLFEHEHEIGTGYGKHNFAELLTFKNSKNPGFFPGECGKLTGGIDKFPDDGTSITRDKVTFYASDLCRPLTFYYDKDVVIDGVKGYRYKATEKTFDNGHYVTANKCFCPGECQPGGLLNITSCAMGAPLFLSAPHFKYADPSYIEAVEGLDPNGEDYDTYIVIEPITGFPIRFEANFQFNILLQPDDTINLFYNAPHIYMPILWTKSYVDLSENKPKLMLLLKVLLLFPAVLYTFFGLMFVTGTLLVTTVIKHTGLEHFKTMFKKKPKLKLPELVPLARPELIFVTAPKKFLRHNTCDF